MTSITKDYSHITDPDQRDAVALVDFVQHIGTTRFQTLVRMTQEGKVPSLQYLRDTCAIMLEVEGFPVEAFIRKYAAGIPEDGQSLVVPVAEVVEYQS